jgi:microcystin-dependent protein
MGCSNCFNGCAEIVSDQCVKYTGIDVPVLGIQKGDSLSYVEQALIEFLTSTLDGTGIKIDIPSEIICELVQQYLPDCGDITVVDLITALIKAACDLQEQVDAVVADVATIEANYDVECLSGVTSTSGTHAILQAVISKLCDLEVDLAALALDVDTNYVKLADLNTLIAAYLASVSPSNKAYNKMVPYSPIPYFGPLTGYPTGGDSLSVIGSGTGYWEDVYLCNGLNGTPDLRGRMTVGVTDGTMGGAAMNSAVNPASSPFNPSYGIGTTAGNNSVTLLTTQIPAHTHTATAVVSPNPHSHTISNQSDNDAGSGKVAVGGQTAEGTNPVTDSVSLAVTVTVDSTGGGQAHANNQPAIGSYYIMYIP